MLKICKHDTHPGPVFKRTSNGLLRDVRMDIKKELFTLKTSHGFTVGSQMSLYLRS
jgi:hypothetical protein